MSKDYAKVIKPGDRARRQSQSSSKGLLFILILLIGGIFYAFSRGMILLTTENSTTGLKAEVEKTKALSTETQSAKSSESTKPRFEFYTALAKETVPVAHGKNTAADVTTDVIEPTPTPLPPKEASQTTSTQQSTTQPGVAPTGVPSVPVHPGTLEVVHAPQKTIVKEVVVSSDDKSLAPVVEAAPAPTPVAATPAPTKSAHYLLQVAALEHMSDVDRLKAQLSFMGMDTIVEPFQNAGKTWYRVKVGSFSSLPEAQKARQTLLQNHLGSILITLPK